MRRLLILTVLLSVSLAVFADEETKRAGNIRAYETDILVDTFGFGPEDIDADFDAVFQGCSHRDCIPSIDEPVFIATGEYSLIDDDEIVLSIDLDGLVRAYPTRILDRHEIVNDRFGDLAVAVTYCPLCGSGLAFMSNVNGQATELGVSGLLHNNDLIMYDRQTKSLWQQITGTSIAGPSRGVTLQSIPVTMVTWGEWREAHPGGEVLMPPLPDQDYSKEPYGDYANSDRILFPIGVMDARLHVKKVIYGIDVAGTSIAIESEWLKGAGRWDHEVDGQSLSLEVDRAGGVRGRLAGKPIPVHRMYWFAWYSFHPDTSLVDERNH